MKKKLILCVLLSALSSTSIAGENSEKSKPDPANLTAPNTFTGLHADNKEVALSLGLAGHAGDYKYLGMLEHKSTYERSNEEKNDRTRARLFGVKAVDWGVVSDVGASVDYIKSTQKNGTDILALGAIAKVNTGLNWMSFFPNLAYVEIKKNGTPSIKETGIQTNLFTSIYLDQNGSYLGLNPSYTKTEDVEIKKLEVSLGTPLTSNAKLWGEIKATYNNTDVTFNNLTLVDDNDNRIQASIYYYF